MKDDSEKRDTAPSHMEKPPEAYVNKLIFPDQQPLSVAIHIKVICFTPIQLGKG
jgi:hypothetical protein